MNVNPLCRRVTPFDKLPKWYYYGVLSYIKSLPDFADRMEAEKRKHMPDIWRWCC